MASIEELDDTAQRLRVMWRKTNNYYASFASVLFDTKKLFEVGNYPGWDFDSWLYQKAGLLEPYVMQQLKVFSRVIAAEEREKVERENNKIAIEKRAAAKVKESEKRFERAERRAAAAHKKREQERIRQEKAAAKLAEKVERDQQKLAEQKAAAARRDAIRQQAEAIRRDEERLKKEEERIRKADARNRQEAARKKAARELAKQAGPENPENPILREGLTECQKIEASTRVQLGAVYVRLKEEVDMRRADKNSGGKPWTWGGWCRVYLDRSRASIKQCIADYSNSLLDGQGLDNSHYENVVSFSKTVG